MKTTKFLILVFLIGLLVCPLIFAQEVIVSYELDSLPVLNHELDRTRERLRAIEDDSSVDLTDEVVGILPLVNGGTGEALVDPGADRIGFWDDSEEEFTWLTAGTGLDITTTTLSADVSEISEYVAGSTYIEAYALTEKRTASGSYTKLKEFSQIMRGGTLYVSWQHKAVGADFIGYSKVYVNSFAVGTEKSQFVNGSGSYTTMSEASISVDAGDIVQIYAYCSITGGGRFTYIDNAYLKCTNPTVTQEAL